MEKIILITCTELDNIFISPELIQSISTKGLIWGSWKNMVSGMLTGNKVRAFPAGCFTGKTHLHIMSEMAKLGAPNSPLGKYPSMLRSCGVAAAAPLGMDALEQRVPLHPCAGQTDSPSAAQVQQCQSSLLTRTKQILVLHQ